MQPVRTRAPQRMAPTPDIVDGLMSQVVHEGLTPHEAHASMPWTASELPSLVRLTIPGARLTPLHESPGGAVSCANMQSVPHPALVLPCMALSWGLLLITTTP